MSSADNFNAVTQIVFFFSHHVSSIHLHNYKCMWTTSFPNNFVILLAYSVI